VIALQTLVLAVFPLSLYLLGKELGSRPLGLAAALLVVLRDLTSNQVAPFTKQPDLFQVVLLRAAGGLINQPVSLAGRALDSAPASKRAWRPCWPGACSA